MSSSFSSPTCSFIWWTTWSWYEKCCQKHPVFTVRNSGEVTTPKTRPCPGPLWISRKLSSTFPEGTSRLCRKHMGLGGGHSSHSSLQDTNIWWSSAWDQRASHKEPLLTMVFLLSSAWRAKCAKIFLSCISLCIYGPTNVLLNAQGSGQWFNAWLQVVKFCESTWNTLETLVINTNKYFWRTLVFDTSRTKSKQAKTIMRIHASRNCWTRFQNVVINCPDKLLEWSWVFKTAKPSFEVVKEGWSLFERIT